MKIAIFSDTFYPNLGGLEDSTMLLAQALGRKGHLVDLYVPKFVTLDFKRRGLGEKEIELGPNVRIHRIFSLPLPGPIPGRLVIPIGQAYFSCKKIKPDIIHLQTMFGAGLEAVFTSYWLKIPLIGTNHSIAAEFGIYLPQIKNVFAQVVGWYDQWFYNHCDFVTAPSQIVLTVMSKYGFHKPNQPISNIIDVQTFSPVVSSVEKINKKSVFNLSDRPVISFAGRFALEKRVPFLFQALAIVKEKKPNVVLALAGHGPERALWDKEIENLKLTNNVNFVGSLSKIKLAELFQASDIFVIASAIESQSMVALQAMACGIPIVGVRGRALPEYVKDGCGFLVPVEDYRAMADSIVEILDGTSKGAEMGQAGRLVAEKYSEQIIAQEWENVYKKAVESCKTS